MSHFRTHKCAWLQRISLIILFFGMLLIGCKEESEPDPEPVERTLTISGPSAGTVWIEGHTVVIPWSSTNLSGDVKIELDRSYPSGAWENIVTGTPNDGNESWTVTLPASPSTRIRIMSVTYPEVGDTTENSVAIVSAMTRAEALPDDAVKITPVMDIFPPVLRSTIWSAPVPLPGPVNTAGVEDLPVITPDGQNLFFFFTPDANVAPGLQAGDGMSGVWWSRNIGGTWSEPERIILFAGEALDSPIHVQGDVLWFASARAGNYGEIDLHTVPWQNGSWADWQNTGPQLNEVLNVGQLALTSDGHTMYFDRLNDAGTNFELWQTVISLGGWSIPVALTSAINTAGHEGQPCLTPDNSEFWFTRDPSGFGSPGPALLRCTASDSAWANPEEILSNFCGDVTIDGDGNLYFTHVFIDSSFHIIETDIYVCYHR